MADESGNHSGPLVGIRILDLTRLYPGPLGTQLMADMGAEVIKIEDANHPDPMRFYPPFIGEQSAGYLAVNRSKQILSIDFASEEGHQKIVDLIRSADILVEQFRPGMMKQFGLDYETAKRHNPRLIYVSLTGYGQTGPYAQKAGHDINYIGYAGILATTGTKESGPILPGVQIADVAGGAYMTVIASLSALWHRQRTGKGQYIDVSMLDSVLPLMTLQLAHFWASGEKQPRGEMLLSGGLASYNVYKCKDGKFVALGALEPKFWDAFCDLVGHPEWKPQIYARGEERTKLKKTLANLFKSKTRDEWIAFVGDRDVCVSPVLEIDEIEKDEHLRERGVLSGKVGNALKKIRGFKSPVKFLIIP